MSYQESYQAALDYLYTFVDGRHPAPTPVAAQRKLQRMRRLLAACGNPHTALRCVIVAGSKGKEAVSYDDLAGLGRRHPLVAVPFVLGVLSLMGFPPTAGFFAKYYVLMAAVQGGGWMLGLAILGVITSAIGAYYYLRVVVYLFMKQPEPGAPVAVPMRSFYVASAIVLSAYFVLRMGLAPGAYLDMAAESAPFAAVGAESEGDAVARF